MRLIDADKVLDGVINPYERISISRWLDDAPTVDAVPVVHGRWIVHYGNWADVYECDQCHHESKEGGKYCSNCGADMRGEQE